MEQATRPSKHSAKESAANKDPGSSRVSNSVKRASEKNLEPSIEDSETKKSVLKPVPVDIFNEPLYNENGTRNTKIPHDLFVFRKTKEEREKNRKPRNVSAITMKDTAIFNEALKSLKRERARNNMRRIKYLKSLITSRKTIKNKLKTDETKKLQDEKYPCFVSNQQVASNRNQPKSRPLPKSQSKSIIKKICQRVKRPIIIIPPLKTKPRKSSNELAEKKPRFPHITIPPFKTRKWVPGRGLPKPKPKVVIDYPPLKLRKRPWKPSEKSAKKKKVFQVNKLFYPMPVFTLGKTWHSFKFISPQQQILSGNFSQYSKRFGFVSNGKQSAFISAVAIATANLYPMTLWKSSILDEIISYGDINFRRRLNSLKHKRVIKPSDVYHKIYLKHAKILVEIGEVVTKGIYDVDDFTEIKSQIIDIFGKFSGLVLIYNCQNYAIWREENAYYILNSEDTDDKGRLVDKRRGACCVIRSTNLPTIVEYLIGSFRVAKHLYEIFSFRVNQKVLIRDLEKQPKDENSNVKLIVNHQLLIASEQGETEGKIVKDSPKTGLAAVLFRHQMEPTFGDNFQSSLIANHLFMTCENYLTREFKNRATYISSVSIVMLQICKSSMWMSATLEKIFKIGHEVYLENVEKVLLEKEMDDLERIKAMEPEIIEEEPLETNENPDDEDEDYDEDEDEDVKPLTKEQIREMRRERLKKPPREFKVKADIPITEIRPVVKIGHLKYEIFVEVLTIGRVKSRHPDELSLELGIKNLFKHYDYGLIIGADVVAIWRENNRYFMFDPNQCKGYRRFNEEEDVDPFNSCLSCFQDISVLVQLYTENLSKAQRQGVYKIYKIETREFVGKSNDWHNFKAISHNKWILCGTISESSDEFSEINKNHQSTCMSVVALAKARELGIFTWTSEIVDEIIRIGDEFYTVCIKQLQEAEKLKNPDLTLYELGIELKLDRVIVDLFYEESVIYGKLHGSDGSYISLPHGLELFFKNDDLGIITASGISVAVVKFSDAYFLFDSHSRDEYGRNFNTVDPINSCTINGTACILRFLNIEDLSNHMIANLECSESSFYTISKVEVSVRSTEPPCLNNYKPFGDENYGAILKAFNYIHEDIPEYKCVKTEKTLCNLVSCLSYSSIFNPRIWAANDINEILKIGWKILCKVSKCSDDFWENLINLDVCSLKLSLKTVNEFNGVFTCKDIMITKNEEDEEVEEHINISEIEVEEEVEDEEEPKTSKERLLSESEIMEFESSSLTLNNVLMELNQNENFKAVLTSSIFSVAIFKLDRFYYIFDPKPSMNGMLVKERLEEFMNNNLMKEYNQLLTRIEEPNEVKQISSEEKMEELIFGRQVVFTAPAVKPSQYEIKFSTSYGDIDTESPVNISEKGCAYVAWFTTVELLIQHILYKIPERFITEPFTLRMMEIQKESTVLPENLKWNNFEAIKDGHWITRGTFSQNDPQFPVVHRNNQDVANCLLALAFMQFCTEQDWNSTVLDVILKFGDRLFRKSLESKLSMGDVQPADLKLKLSDMKIPIFIRPYVIICAEECFCTDFIIKSSDVVALESFKESVMKFLESEGTAGFLVSKNYYVSIWKSSDGSFYMFDSHDIGPDGLRKSTGLSSLQRFTNSSDLVEVFWNNIKDIDGFNEYKLIRIKIELNHYKDGEDDVFEDIDCDLPSSQVKIIYGSAVKVIAQKVEMSVCYAIAAYSLCQSLESEYYTSDMIDRIIMFGNELACECSTNDEVCFKDFNLAKHSSCPDEINWNFQLNNTFTTVQMDIFRRGIIIKQPCPLPNLIFVLEEFFQFHSSGLLVTSEFIIPIWKDNNEYFLFYSCPIDVNALRRSDGTGRAGLCIFKSVHELYTNILKNIRQQSLPFEMRICSIKMTDDVVNPENKSCMKKFSKKSMKKIVNDEIIMPAVSFREMEDVKTANDEKEPDLGVSMKSVMKGGKNKGFIKYLRGGLLCGNLSKDSKSLNESSRQYHSPTICLYSAAMHTVLNMNCWNIDTIDCVILSGNNLYVESSIICGTSEVDITSVMTPMVIGDHELNATAELCLEITKESFEIEQLKPIICELLSCFNACYVKRSWNCWTIVKTDTFYFLFDPLGIKVAGKKISQYHASLYRFDSLELLLEQLKDCTSNLKDECDYEIGGILTNIIRTVKGNEPKKSLILRKKVSTCPSFQQEKPFLHVDLRAKSNLCEN